MSVDSQLDPYHAEYQYLTLLGRTILTGNRVMDRTGVGTRALFGAQHRYSLKDGTFPLFTTKRTFFRGIVEELLWFLRGDTNGKHLLDKGIKIWEGNGTREYLDSIGLRDRAADDLGPIYGFQWRHFGAKYTTCDADYTDQGVDQLTTLIETIKTRPNDRRMILSAWNPAAHAEMALPPCHVMAQFYVADGYLSCMMTQRSCDMGLGVPFNVASYSLLTIMIAHVCGLKPGELIHSMGNVHVYENHVSALKSVVTRAPRPFPKLRIRESAQDKTIDQFAFDDFELSDYQPHPTVRLEMAV